MEIKIRTATERDAETISILYSETVRKINSKDYSEEQIKVWSGGSGNLDHWKRHIGEQYFIVAETDNVIVGFSSITPEGYLDFMYVHKNFQRAGVAKKLLEEIERKAAEQKNSEVYSHVSKTAKGFFEKFGYKHTGDLIDPYKGVVFINSIMKKKF